MKSLSRGSKQPRLVDWPTRIMQAGLFGLCLVVPFLWNPWSFSTGSYPMFYAVKECVSWAFIAIIIMAWAARCLDGHQLAVRRHVLYRVFLPLGFIVLWAVLSYMISVNREVGWNPLVNLILYILLFVALATSIRLEEIPRWVGLALVAPALTGLLCLLQYFNLDPIFSTLPLDEAMRERTRLRVIGIVGQVGMAGAYLAIAFPVALALAFAAPKAYRLWGMGATVLIGLGLMATLTRASIIGALLGIMIVGTILFLRRDRTRRLQLRSYGLGILAVVLGMAIFIGTVPAVRERLAKPVVKALEGDLDAALNHRYFPWRVTWLMIQDRPLWGSGIGTFASQYGTYQIHAIVEKGYKHPGTGLQWAHAHNEYLQLWAEMGLVGLVLATCSLGGLLLLGIQVPTSISSPQEKRWDNVVLVSGLLGGVVAGAIVASVNFIAHQPMTAFLLIFWSALIVAAAQPASESVTWQAHSLRNWQRVGAKAVIVIIAGLVIWGGSRPLLAQHYEDKAKAILAQINKEGASLGRAHVKLLLEEAIKYLRQAAQHDPSQWSIHNNLGLAHLYRRELHAAIEHYEASLRYVVTPAAYTNLGFAYEQLGDREKALYYYRRALLLNPRFREAKEGLSLLEGGTQ